MWWQTFSASLPQSSVARDPSEIILICWFGAQEFNIITNVKNSCAASYFCGNRDPQPFKSMGYVRLKKTKTGKTYLARMHSIIQKW